MATLNPAPNVINQYLSGLLRHGTVYQNSLGETHVYLPERLPHSHDEMVRTHVCRGAENLFDICVQHYKSRVRDPIDTVEIVAQYQEDPIIDYSIPPPAGTVLQMPSPAYIQDVAYGESLTEFPVIA